MLRREQQRFPTLCGIVWLLMPIVLNLAATLPESDTFTTLRSTIVNKNNCDRQQLKYEIEEQMDINVTPCDDFYEYACGNWRVAYGLRVLGARDVRTTVKAMNKELLMHYFEHTKTHEIDTSIPMQQQFQQENDPPTQKQLLALERRAITDFYNSCLNMQVRGASRDAIHNYIHVLRQFNEWSELNLNFVEDNANASFNWLHASAKLRGYGVQSFWRLLVQPNWQAEEQQIFYIMPPTFKLLKGSATGNGNAGVSSSNSSNSSVEENDKFLYETYIKYLLLDLGVRVRKAKSIAAEVVQFEEQLLALTNEHADTLLLHAPQTLLSLATNELPQVDLLGYFDTLLSELNLPTDNMKHLLIVADTLYLRRLVALLERTSAEIIGKYLLVQFLAHFEVHLHEVKTYNEQLEHCLQQLNDFMPTELSRLFIHLLQADARASVTALHSDDDALNYMKNIQSKLQKNFELLKIQFERMLNVSDIFENDASAHNLGLEKIRAMRLLLPTQQQLSVPTASWTEINEFSFGDNYDQNLLKFSKKRTMQEFRRVCQSQLNELASSSSSSKHGPLDVNAYYQLKLNAIELPIGLLRPPFWQSCAPETHVYGRLNYIIAHELIHGFDFDGYFYDKSSSQLVTNWKLKAFLRFGCYWQDRYSNAIQNINENIADTEGLRLSLETYKQQHTNDSISDDDLKTIFTSFAQTWCGRAVTGAHTQHAKHRERVNNVLSNFPEFARIYKCELGSPMHPNKKCRFW